MLTIKNVQFHLWFPNAAYHLFCDALEYLINRLELSQTSSIRLDLKSFIGKSILFWYIY